MSNFEQFMLDNNLEDSEDIESLIELAEITREQISIKRYEDINKIINYTIENNYYEAFSWVIEILQEEFEKEECQLKSFTCDIGKKIMNYNEFIERLQVDFNELKNDIKNVYDNNGEMQSFFINSIYKTKYKNVFLISKENFDTRDNDYIQYKILFTKELDNNNKILK